MLKLLLINIENKNIELFLIQLVKHDQNGIDIKI